LSLFFFHGACKVSPPLEVAKGYAHLSKNYHNGW
jgi:hypothetical protein